MLSRIHAYFTRLERASTIKFIVVLALIAFFIKVPTGILGAWMIDFFSLSNPLFSSIAQEPTFEPGDLLLAIVFAPIMETLLGQMLPIELLSRATKNTAFLVIASSSLFMALHYPVIEFFPSAFAVGCVFAWAWIVKRKIGLMRTFGVVTLIHSLHNALVAALGAFLI